MDLAPVNRFYTNSRSFRTSPICGPLDFIKLALEDLKVPYIYLKRTLWLPVAEGASFQVHYFDLEHPLTTDVMKRKGIRFERGQWLVSKHVSPPTPEQLELASLEDESSDTARLADISLEMRILSHEPLRNHPNVVQIIGFSWEKHADEYSRRWPILVTENANIGTLADFFRIAHQSLHTIDIRKSLALDIARGVHALHNCGIVHGDIKPQNILMFEQGDNKFTAKLSDFGSATSLLDILESNNDETASTFLPAFTRPWEAPEAVDAITATNLPKVDVFSFGLLHCYLMASGEELFSPHIQGTEYDLNAISNLKTHDEDLLQYAKSFLASKGRMDQLDYECATRVVAATLRVQPHKRRDMAQVHEILCEDIQIPMEMYNIPPIIQCSFYLLTTDSRGESSLLPLPFEDDPSSDGLPEVIIRFVDPNLILTTS
jgi:serine/threonine protein kinase